MKFRMLTVCLFLSLLMTPYTPVSSEPMKTDDDSIEKYMLLRSDKMYDRGAMIETQTIGKYSEHVKRNGKSLTLKIEDPESPLQNKTIELLNKPEQNKGQGDFEKYFFINYFEKLNLYLVLYVFYDGYSYLVYNSKSGQRFILDEYPVLSPSSMKFLVSSDGLVSGELPNSFSIYRVSSDSIEIEYRTEPTQWEPLEATWKDDDEIIFKKVFVHSIPPKSIPCKATYDSDKDQWNLVQE